MGEGRYLENPPEPLSHAAQSSQEVADEKGLGGAAAPQDDQALAQVLCSRELRSNISVQRSGVDHRSTASHARAPARSPPVAEGI